MTCTQALFSLFLFAPCDDSGGGHAALEAALSDAARPAADVERDAQRKPGQVLGFFDIRAGMTVLEVFSGGGYYTQILDGVVGANGRVLAQNNQAYMSFVGPQFAARFEAGGMPNTETVIVELNDIELEDDSLDAALMVLTWHDFLHGDPDNNWPDVDETALVGKLCTAMKPGAVLGIVDHQANPGGDPHAISADIHRIDPDLVKAELDGTCFELAAESDLLRNAEDDHQSNAWNGPYKGRTDRFILKYVRK